MNIRVRCKNPNCKAEAEGETFDIAANKVDHAIALGRDPMPGRLERGCPGGKDCLEVLDGKGKVVPKESLAPTAEDFRITEKSENEGTGRRGKKNTL